MFKRLLVFALTLILLTALLPVQAQAGVRIVCPDGQVIENGVEIIVNMRPGFTYTATAVGINGFDPVLAVSDQYGTSLCADDDSTASTYSVNLPTTGLVPQSLLSSQVPFSHSYDGFHDISITVGGFENTSGEFVVILEGMAVTSADGSGLSAGDPFSLHITPNMTASGVPITAYMISVTDSLDPLMKIMSDDDQPLVFDDGSYFACDDSGDLDLCWGESYSLVGSYVSRTQGRQLPGGPLDAMMIVPIEDLGMAPDEDGYLNWKMTSSSNETSGDYVVVYHVGTGVQGQSGTNSAQSTGDVDSAGNLHQWASFATATSQYSDTRWNALQATGAPDTDTCGDVDTAWASSSATGSDVLTLDYDQAVVPRQINIYETFNPGSIIKVEAVNSSGGAPITLAKSDDPPGNTACPGVFTINVSDVTVPIDRLMIYVDQTIGGSWNEIDAVELVGVVAVPADV